jgi:PAS domain S-box-containing protein
MKKVLLIEDDRILRENTEIFLGLKKYEVITAEDGMSGLRLAMDQLPDIIICDITMPIMNGFEVLKSLRANETTSVIPFIFLTAKAEKEDYRKGLQLGVDDYISKPFNFNELHSAIELRLEKAEKLIRSATEQYNSLMEISPFGFFIYRMNRIEYANPRFLEFTGYSLEELSVIDTTTLIPDKEIEKFILLLEHCGDEKSGNCQTEVTVIKKDGEPKVLLLACAVARYRPDGRYIFIASEKSGYPSNTGLPKEIIDQLQKLNPESLAALTGHIQVNSRISRYTEQLSSRETEILGLICNGLTTLQISEKLFISPRTVEFHRANLMCKTGSKNVADLVKFAIRTGVAGI